MDKPQLSGAYFTRFDDNPDGGGGSRRTLQIWQALQPFGCRLISTIRGDGVTPEQLALINARERSRLWQMLALRGAFRLWHGRHRKRAYRLHAYASAWAQTFAGCAYVAVDDPMYFGPLVRAAQKQHIPVIAICHNFETLDVAQPDARRRFRLFEKELTALAACDLVVTIAREDTVLLNNFGAKTLFIPYYPADAILARFKRIREHRAQTVKRNYLLLGSAANPATREGMLAVIDGWKNLAYPQAEDHLLVAGFAMDRAFPDMDALPEIEMLGTLDTAAHDRLLGTVKACICYQERGSGALTRIPELLIAGVPVLANTQAVRSYYNQQGVVEFADLNALPNGLRQVERAAPVAFPMPEKADMSRLDRFLRTVINQNAS